MFYSRNEWEIKKAKCVPKLRRVPTTYTHYSGYKWHNDTDTKQNYNFITNDYDEIIRLLADKEYDKICDMFRIYASFAPINYLTNTFLCYCIQENDIKMFNLLIDSNFFDNSISTLLNKVIISSNCDMFKIIIDNDRFASFFDNDKLNFLAQNITSKNKTSINFLDMLVNKGMKISDQTIQQIINMDNHKDIQYVINAGHDIQNCFDNMLPSEILISLPTLKILHNNINISKHVNQIYLTMLHDNHIGAVTYLLDHFPELDLVEGFNMACNNNQIEVMKLFLNRGLSISNIYEDVELKNLNFNMVKFLIDCGYPAGLLNLNDVLVKVFNTGDNIKDVYYLIEWGADITYITDDKQKISNNDWFDIDDMIKSNIENVIYNGQLGHVKFLIDNYYELVQHKISDMFVIACANGKMDIAKYLLGYDVQMNIKALTASCFFGHGDIVIMLLELGLNFEDVKENLFDVAIFGKNSANRESDIYDRLVDDDIFKNDLYEYGKDHYKIIQLLMKHELPVGKCNFLPRIGGEFCNVEFYKYIMMNVEDVNEKFGGITLLESSVSCRNKEVTEMLLKYGLSLMKPIIIVPSGAGDDNMKNLLLKYGQEVGESCQDYSGDNGQDYSN